MLRESSGFPGFPSFRWHLPRPRALGLPRPRTARRHPRGRTGAGRGEGTGPALGPAVRTHSRCGSSGPRFLRAPGPRAGGGAWPASSAGRRAAHVRAGGEPRRRGRATRKSARTCRAEPAGRRAAGRRARCPSRGRLCSQVGGGEGAEERSRDLRDSSRHTESPAEQSLEDASAPREELTLLPSTGASSVAAAPRPRSAGNFPSKVILWAGRGGARGPPTSSRSAGAGEVRPVLSRSNVAGRRPRALHRRLVASPEPGACASPGSTRFSPPAA